MELKFSPQNLPVHTLPQRTRSCTRQLRHRGRLQPAQRRLSACDDRWRHSAAVRAQLATGRRLVGALIIADRHRDNAQVVEKDQDKSKGAAATDDPIRVAIAVRAGAVVAAAHSRGLRNRLCAAEQGRAAGIIF